jgi:hypothetical protein
MTLGELLPAVHALPRGDKLRLMQVLVGDLALEESLWAGTGQAEHHVWAPHDAFDAAATLLQVLNTDQTAPT